MRVRVRRLRVRVRLRGRRAVRELREALESQSSRLAPFRERLLRRVAPALRGATLDLACGFGVLTSDLVARVRGPVVALDRDAVALGAADAGARRIRGDVAALPFRDRVFDLVVTQHAWLWFGDIDAAAREVRRVLAPGGVLVIVGEPDFGGAIEHPPEIALAPTWEAALRRAGADPQVGRKLRGALRRAGLRCETCEIMGDVMPPDGVASLRAEEGMLLADLLDDAERAALSRTFSAAPPDAFVFVPILGLVAARP